MATVKKQPVRNKTRDAVKAPRKPARPKLPSRTAGRAASADEQKLRPAAAIVPPQSVAGRALTLVVAIMSFLACLTVGAVSIVWDAADAWQNDLVREVTIQIRPADGVDMIREIDKAVALAQEFAGVGAVRALSDEETKALLQPWLGEGLELAGLPFPGLSRSPSTIPPPWILISCARPWTIRSPGRASTIIRSGPRGCPPWRARS